MFQEVPKSVRLSKEVVEKIELLLKEYPDKYENESHVIRCAVIYLWKRENEGSKDN